jgi:hypothetical protein
VSAGRHASMRYRKIQAPRSWPAALIYCGILLVLAPAPASAQDAGGLPQVEPVAKNVTIGLFVLDLFSMDSVDQTTSVDFIVRMQWHEPSLEGGAESTRFVSLEHYWAPELQIINARNLHKRTQGAAEVAPDGTVTYRERYVGTITTRLDLADFPFDRHRIGIRAAVTAFQDTSITVRNEWSGQAGELTIADWRIGSGSIRLDTISAAGRTLPSVLYEVDAVRHTGYWVWKVMFPLVLIVGMSWAVFWIDPSNAGPQIGTATASMLTLIAYRFALGGLIPKVSYFTRMDSFITASTLVVFLALLVAILTGKLATSDRRELAGRIDVACRVLFPVSFLGVIVYSFWI